MRKTVHDLEEFLVDEMRNFVIYDCEMLLKRCYYVQKRGDPERKSGNGIIFSITVKVSSSVHATELIKRRWLQIERYQRIKTRTIN